MPKNRKLSCRAVATCGTHARRVAIELSRLFPFALLEVRREVDEAGGHVVRYDPDEVPPEVVEYAVSFYHERPTRPDRFDIGDVIRGYLK